jgi:hypothetical protein
MTDEQIRAVAKYFTGNSVVAYSIGLEMPTSAMHPVAKDYFAAREALGITGYITEDQAVNRIEHAIGR